MIEKFKKLCREIIALSCAQDWNSAKTEWKLLEVYEADPPESCLCGHHPIREICVLENILNHNTANVGNVCVKKFLGLPSDTIFQSIKRVRKSPDKSLGEKAIEYAYNRRWINKWEYDFYLDTRMKRKFPKILSVRRKINTKVLQNMARKKTDAA